MSSGGELREGAKMIPGHMQISGETGIVHPPISLYISNPQARFCHLILNYIFEYPSIQWRKLGVAGARITSEKIDANNADLKIKSHSGTVGVNL